MSDDNYDEDYNHSRQMYYDLSEKSLEAIEKMMVVFEETEHPRAGEVLATLLKNASDINDKLMDLNKKHKDITKPEKEDQPALPNQTTNNVFIGSTTDLQRMLQDANKPVEKDITPDDRAEG